MKRIRDCFFDLFVSAVLLGFGFGFWALLLVLALLFARAPASAADAIPVDAVVLQEATRAETADTVLDRGEAIVVFDELADQTAATMRIGDGSIVGGRTITDPYSVRATTTRTLSPREYALIPGGETVYTNGAWVLLPARVSDTATSRTGTLQVVSLYTISSVSWSQAAQNTTISISPSSQAAGVTNAVLLASEQDTSYPLDVTFRAAVSNLSVSAYVAPHLLGETNDFRNSKILVRDPGERSFVYTQWESLGDDEPVPRAWHDRDLADNYGEDWWRYSAGGDVSLDRQSLRYSSTLRALGAENTLRWVHRTGSGTDRDVLSAQFGSGETSATNQTFEILAYDLDADPLSLWISATADFESQPVIQHVGSLTSGDPWTNCVTTTDWPATTNITVEGETRTTYHLQCANPGEGFFRVCGAVDSETAVSDYIAFDVADLRNSGTITAGQGFRVASPPGSTNYVTAVTTNLAVLVPGGGTNTLHYIGGVLTGITE